MAISGIVRTVPAQPDDNMRQVNVAYCTGTPDNAQVPGKSNAGHRLKPYA